MRIVILCGGVVALIGTAALAGEDVSANRAVDKSQKIVCKVEKSVGTMISERTCKTRAEWDQIAQDAKLDMDQRQLPVQYKDPPGQSLPVGYGGNPHF
jgi:hypothetical protein